MSSDFEQNFGRKIRLARQRAGLTQEDLAGKIGRTPESVSNIERGLQEPGIKTVLSLSQALNLPVSEFFEASDTQTSEERQEKEFQLRDLARQLNDRDLAVVLAHIQTLLVTK
ncbi:MAG: helix-turn-helix transcriptional regulator [Afipia felis]|nr:helix-turn-helix transcriptional regulator [Afipia felis]